MRMLGWSMMSTFHSPSFLTLRMTPLRISRCGHSITQPPASVSSSVKWNQWLSRLPVNPYVGGSFLVGVLGVCTTLCPALQRERDKRRGGPALPMSCPLLSRPPGRKEQLRPELPEVREAAISTHPPKNPARATWTSWSSRCMELLRTEKRKASPTPGPEHRLGHAPRAFTPPRSLIGVPSPAPVHSMGPQESSPPDFAEFSKQGVWAPGCVRPTPPPAP